MSAHIACVSRVGGNDAKSPLKVCLFGACKSQNGELAVREPPLSNLMVIFSFESRSLPIKDTGQSTRTAKLWVHSSCPSGVATGNGGVMGWVIDVPFIPIEFPSVQCGVSYMASFKLLNVAPESNNRHIR